MKSANRQVCLSDCKPNNSNACIENIFQKKCAHNLRFRIVFCVMLSRFFACASFQFIDLNKIIHVIFNVYCLTSNLSTLHTHTKHYTWYVKHLHLSIVLFVCFLRVRALQCDFDFSCTR